MNSPLADDLLRLALAEDVGTGDRTTLACIPEDARSTASVVAKAPLVLAGARWFARVFELLDPNVTVFLRGRDGERLDAGDVALTLEGPSRSVLTGERTALNVLQRLSGTATLTRAFVDAVDGTQARVCDTRKTTPGMRLMQKEAVAAGGGANHRFGLDSGLMVKDNHIAAAGGLAQAVAAVKRAAPHVLKVEVEVVDLAGVREALAAGADVLLLDNMTEPAMAECVELVRASDQAAHVVTEASGNITLARARAVAETGVDFLSVGALTHSAPAADLSLRISG